ncbi:hypothetical protein TVAG_483340 [Trichomonas vaginalis G3]|uniref:Uncharacterized protein n=1 Tax=Trichomonas vaginalis (strain ATCC PRA-98 / G3) TaxID=412133 RepID=A2ETA7_TRIV3|nr:hypothetical protein TVAGG3_0620300 [Trichomonas vaginalis G3]EAY04097.1 hypothetical protein TVAG_483340 [Trichomonas vaginalis G3]KAI5503847.1 hypothetical protein TVAGG3_0620300 [Trichomonas vaginalis G3]|eukprot:XP_001316320.1 hypothetical protein [Trichomonas vaginalis G3]
MTKTKLYSGYFVPFPDEFKCQDKLTNPEKFEPYERPTDLLGSHYLTFDILQKQIILGSVKRYIHLDYYRKRISIRSKLEGIVFEARATAIKEYIVDQNDVHLVRIRFSHGIEEQLCWLESSEAIHSLFDALTDFIQSCRK